MIKLLYKNNELMTITYFVTGIISDINKCDNIPAVSIFTRVGPHLNWILQQTNDACYCSK